MPSGFSRRRHPNSRDDATAPGFFNRGRGPLLSHPPDDGSAPGFHPHASGFFPSARNAFRFYPAASSEFQGRRHGSGVFQSRRGPLLSHPERTTARIIPERGGIHPIRRTTDQRRRFHPDGSPGGSRPFHPGRDDADRTVLGRGGGSRPILDNDTALASRTTDAVRFLPKPNRTIRRRDDDDSASSVSLFSCLSLCLCAWLSIAGNKVPPALDDIGSMGGTNSKKRDPTLALPKGRGFWAAVRPWQD
jgi:hypothetical protein